MGVADVAPESSSGGGAAAAAAVDDCECGCGCDGDDGCELWDAMLSDEEARASDCDAVRG